MEAHHLEVDDGSVTVTAQLYKVVNLYHRYRVNI